MNCINIYVEKCNFWKGIRVSTKVMSPVLKWAGGKTQLLEELMSKVPRKLTIRTLSRLSVQGHFFIAQTKKCGHQRYE